MVKFVSHTNMHMFGAMYGINDFLTGMVMVPYLNKKMEIISYLPITAPMPPSLMLHANTSPDLSLHLTSFNFGFLSSKILIFFIFSLLKDYHFKVRDTKR